MNYICTKRFFSMAFLAIFAAVSPLHAAPPKAPTEPNAREQFFIDELAPGNTEKVITEAMTQLESLHKADIMRTNSIPALKKLLPDSREAVRTKAGRVLGIFHAPLDDNDIKELTKQLKSDSWKEVQAGLKSIRDLYLPATVPDILPCLKNSNPYVVRDACRTLAVIANKDVIPSIEPLLKDPNPKIQEDAQAAIVALRNRP